MLNTGRIIADTERKLFIFLEFRIKKYTQILPNYQCKSQLQSPSSKVGSVTSQKPKFNE